MEPPAALVRTGGSLEERRIAGRLNDLRVRAMEIRYVEEPDCNRQALLNSTSRGRHAHRARATPKHEDFWRVTCQPGVGWGDLLRKRGVLTSRHLAFTVSWRVSHALRT